ncbi:MAG: hypothetical protein AAFY56_15495 [Pseudomonadota bacterium]
MVERLYPVRRGRIAQRFFDAFARLKRDASNLLMDMAEKHHQWAPMDQFCIQVTDYRFIPHKDCGTSQAADQLGGGLKTSLTKSR